LGTESRHGRNRRRRRLGERRDRALAQAGHLPEANIRRTRVKAVVDTGAVMLALPEDVVERLGVPVVGSVACVPAGGRRGGRPVAGPVTVHIGDRSMPANCVVVPAGAHAVIGRVILAQLDLAADRVNQTLGPRPESPHRPLARL
jgi:predicted aspartyl protease